MKVRKVIDRNNIPPTFPLFPTLVLYLCLDKWEAPGWVWGSVGAVMLLVWIAAIVEVSRAETVDVFKEKS